MRPTIAILPQVVKDDLTIQFGPQALTSVGGRSGSGAMCANRFGAPLRQTFAGLRSDQGGARIALARPALFFVGAPRLEHPRYLGGDPLVTRFCSLARLPTRRTVAAWLRRVHPGDASAVSRPGRLISGPSCLRSLGLRLLEPRDEIRFVIIKKVWTTTLRRA